MSCAYTLSGIARDCERNSGGVKALAFAIRDDVTAKTLSTSGEKIDSITMASGKKYKAFYFKKGMAEITSAPSFNEAGEYAGEVYTIAVQFGRQDTTKRVQMDVLSKAELDCLYQDNNGIWWNLGYASPVMRNGGDSGTGANREAFNRYGMQFTCEEDGFAIEVDADGAEAVIG